MRVFDKDVQDYVTIRNDVHDDILNKFLTDVLGLESLHVGYWNKENPSDLSLENVKRAQRQFSNHLLDFIPKGVKHILDVGCGIGDHAQILAEQGYEITCISPDKNDQKAFETIGNHQITFSLDGIETFESDQIFDLVLMSESSNYFDMDIGFAKCRSLLRDDGHILSASLFRKDGSDAYGHYHVENEWLQCAKNHGYDVIEIDDITKNVLPTFEFGHHLLNRYAIPINRLVMELAEKPSGWKSKVRSFLLRPVLSRINDYLWEGYLSDFCDPQLFRDKAKYVIYLFCSRDGLTL